MIGASRHCGAVELDIDAPPSEVTDRNGSICRRYGALWACCPLASVRFGSSGAQTETHLRDDRAIGFHRCTTCGCVCCWNPVDRRVDRMGVDARMMPPEALAMARVRRLDGATTERHVD